MTVARKAAERVLAALIETIRQEFPAKPKGHPFPMMVFLVNEAGTVYGLSPEDLDKIGDVERLQVYIRASVSSLGVRCVVFASESTLTEQETKISTRAIFITLQGDGRAVLATFPVDEDENLGALTTTDIFGGRLSNLLGQEYN